ncbi:Uncharacterised protein [Helicobacter mustelae]|nr:Uncharacterised protein [Helicobacter mustelae]
MFCTASKLNKGHLRQDKITRGVLRGIKQSLNKGVGNLLRIFYELRKDGIMDYKKAFDGKLEECYLGAKNQAIIFGF